MHYVIMFPYSLWFYHGVMRDIAPFTAVTQLKSVSFLHYPSLCCVAPCPHWLDGCLSLI